MATVSRPREDAPALAVHGKTIAGQVGWLALPVFIEQLLLYLVGLSDTVLTGHFLAVAHLAAVTVCAYLIWFLGSMMTVVSAGATALVARMIGGGDRPEASRICGQAIGLAIGFGLFILLAGWAAAPFIVRGLGLTGLAAKAATSFLRIVLLATPLLACEQVGVACLRGAGDTRTGMWVMVLMNAINVSLAWSLVRGLGPFPAIGLDGIAIGTATGEATAGIIVLCVLARGRSGLRLKVRALVPVFSRVWRILRISLPAAAESFTNGMCQLWFLGLINRLGETSTAAHGVAIRTEAIAFLTVNAFGVAACTLTGQYLGAARPDLASRAARSAWAIGVCVISVFAAILFFKAETLFALFLSEGRSEVLAHGVPVLRLIAFALPALATITVLTGALRGAGDTRGPWYIVIFGYFVLRIPLTYLLATPPTAGGLGWGLYGAWVAMFVDIAARGLLVALRFLRGRWKAIRV
jgi:putative MATE family efflux protein